MKFKFDKTRLLKAVLWILFIAYIAALFKILIFRYLPISQLFSGSYGEIRSINLIPFKTVIQDIVNSRTMGYMRAISNTFGNIIIFIPFGYFIPSLNEKYSRFSNVLISTACFSLFFEISQYILGVGSSDVDDIILNTTGGIIGYVLYKYINKLIPKRNTFYMSIIITTFIFFIGGGIVAVDQFGTYLGISKLHEQVIGGENVPKGKADIFGKLVNSSSDLVTIDTNIGNEKDESIKDESIIVASNNIKNANEKKAEVMLNKSTKVYLKKGVLKKKFLKGYSLTVTYSKISTENISKLSSGAKISVWGKYDKGKLIANVISIEN
ncbi:VanZ family protein [Clostridium scatologenes]|uniref:Putative conserved membrane protein n=1 Tax=Clostridium scatologenes TaxID=1548 RepID=A0A0E3GPU8_CLOSL|nr:VanZ family protein [Clostridium scatologenes]AKA67446.1 putative conserved membrane protein [Clostridium scatologenes]